MYDYRKEVRYDVEKAISDYEWGKAFSDPEFTDIEGLKDEMEEALSIDDSVTGNSSGSYTCDRELAKEYVLENMQLLRDACDYYWDTEETIGAMFLNEEWEWFDITIRCYILKNVISDIVEEAFG